LERLSGQQVYFLVARRPDWKSDKPNSSGGTSPIKQCPEVTSLTSNNFSVQADFLNENYNRSPTFLICNMFFRHDYRISYKHTST
jgi:hypothetical protein